MNIFKLAMMILAGLGCLTGQELTKVSLNLRNEKGDPIAKARIVLVYESLNAATQKLLQYRGQSDDKGLAEFPGVLPGRYRYCVAAPDAFVLNPCEWKAPGTHLEVSDSSAAQKAPIPVTLAQGVLLKIVIEDDADVLSKNEHKTEKNHVSFDLWSVGSGSTRLVEQSAREAKRRGYVAIVPKLTQLKLRVASPGFAIETKERPRRVDEPGQDLDLHVTDVDKEVVLSVKALK